MPPSSIVREEHSGLVDLDALMREANARTERESQPTLEEVRPKAHRWRGLRFAAAAVLVGFAIGGVSCLARGTVHTSAVPISVPAPAPLPPCPAVPVAT